MPHARGAIFERTVEGFPWAARMPRSMLTEGSPILASLQRSFEKITCNLHTAATGPRHGARPGLWYVRRACERHCPLGRSRLPRAALTGRDYVAAITRSRKKWELASTCGLFIEQMRGSDRVRSGGTKTRWRRRSCLATMRAAVEQRDARRLHEDL